MLRNKTSQIFAQVIRSATGMYGDVGALIPPPSPSAQKRYISYLKEEAAPIPPTMVANNKFLAANILSLSNDEPSPSRELLSHVKDGTYFVMYIQPSRIDRKAARALNAGDNVSDAEAKGLFPGHVLGAIVEVKTLPDGSRQQNVRKHSVTNFLKENKDKVQRKEQRLAERDPDNFFKYADSFITRDKVVMDKLKIAGIGIVLKINIWDCDEYCKAVKDSDLDKKYKLGRQACSNEIIENVCGVQAEAVILQSYRDKFNGDEEEMIKDMGKPPPYTAMSTHAAACAIVEFLMEDYSREEQHEIKTVMREVGLYRSGFDLSPWEQHITNEQGAKLQPAMNLDTNSAPSI